MDNWASWKRRGKNRARERLAQLPRAIGGVGARTLQVDLSPIRRDGRDDAMPRVCEGAVAELALKWEAHEGTWGLKRLIQAVPAAPTTSQIIDTLLQLLARGSRCQWQDLITEQIVVHAGQGTAEGIHVVFHHHWHLESGGTRLASICTRLSGRGGLGYGAEFRN